MYHTGDFTLRNGEIDAWFMADIHAGMAVLDLPMARLHLQRTFAVQSAHLSGVPDHSGLSLQAAPTHLAAPLEPRAA